MRLAHFEAFKPICLACRDRAPSALVVGPVIRSDGGDVVEGTLVCPEPTCRYEYPIIDGIPLLVANVREVVQKQLGEIIGRDDLSPATESLLGDCAGPGSDFDRARYHQSIYARGHWSDLDPDEPAPAAIAPVLEAVVEVAGPPRGRWLDIGCSVGRTTFELASRSGELALGVDLNFSMLRVARRVAVEGRVRHPLRRLGLVYDRKDFAVTVPARDKVDFWLADATALPFADHTVDGAVSLNLVDCVSWPLSHLLEIARVLQDEGRAVIASPYDWNPGATPVEGWLGGHSQRGPHRGSSVAEVRRILARGKRPAGAPELALLADRDDVPWSVYVHERATMHYRLHVIAVEPDR